MTDDDRMDRAQRIREMREGSRSTDEEQSAESADAPTAESGDGTAAESGSDGDSESMFEFGGDAPADSGAEATTDTGTADAGANGADAGRADAANGTADAAGAADVTHPDAADLSEAVADAVGRTGSEGDGEPAGRPEGAGDESGDAGSLQVSSAEFGDVEVDVEELARQAGLESAAELPTEDAGDAPLAGETDDLEGVGTGAVARGDTGETDAAEETRVLEFGLGDEQYCLDIEYVEEIVKRETVTRVPNTPDCVEGVVDLRGQITTILDPKVLLDIDREGSKDLIVVFDPEQFDDHGAVGWVVDDVERVIPVTEDEVNSSPVEQDHVNGVVDRDGEFVIWTTPELDVEELAG